MAISMNFSERSTFSGRELQHLLDHVERRLVVLAADRALGELG
jgi:hypothetical protein